MTQAIGVLTDYIHSAMSEANYELLEDKSYAGTIPSCPGVLGFGSTMLECQIDVRSALEDWILLGLRFDDEFQELNGNRLALTMEPELEPVDSV